MQKKKTTTRGQNSERDYVAIATKYAKQVVAGEIPACKWVRLACQRQLDDLSRVDWTYRFDRKAANRVCKFIELLPHVKGKWSSSTITLEPWQCFVLTTVFGWIDADGCRRFRKSYTEVPRKNAKSTASSGVGLYMTVADEEPGAEVYSAATTRDQARIVWDDSRKMVDKTEGLRRRYGVETLAHAIAVSGTASSFKALSSEGNTLDGLNVHCAVIDELHAHKTREVFDVINSATGSRTQPLIWCITTAGFNRAGVCYEQREYVTKVLERIHEDETYFGIIYTIDEGDDWTEESAWRKANPNYGVSVLEKDIATACRQAMLSAQSQNNFLTKRLNVWVSAETSWMNMQAWDACGDKALQLEDFEGEECYIGVDLATKIDIAAAMLVFPRPGGEFVVFGKYYLPEAAVEAGINSNAAHYSGWAHEGLLTLTPGDVTDFEQIQDDLFEVFRRFKVEKLVFDPACQAQDIANRLVKLGIRHDRIIDVPTRTINVSTPMKELEAMVLQKKLRHNGDKVLTWMASNVVAKSDARENIFPRKERPENKIDGIVALILALSQALKGKQQAPSVYETRGLLSI